MGSTQSKKIVAITIPSAICLLSLYMLQDSSKAIGIRNLGNTCYLNALLQFLVASDLFIQYLESLNKNLDNDHGQLARSLHYSLLTMRASEELQPEQLLNSITKVFNHFGQQQDTHELFQVILDSLENCNTPSTFIPEIQCQNPLLGVLGNTLECKNCGNLSLRLQSFMDISIDLKYNTLAENIKDFLHDEVVSEVTCGKCSLHNTINYCQQFPAHLPTLKALQRLTVKPFIEYEEVQQVVNKLNVEQKYFIPFQDTRVEMVKSIKIMRMPQLLCIHLKRLVSVHEIILKYIYFEEILILNGTKYQLKSVIEHTGGPYFGHFFTYRKQGKS